MGVAIKLQHVREYIGKMRKQTLVGAVALVSSGLYLSSKHRQKQRSSFTANKLEKFTEECNNILRCESIRKGLPGITATVCINGRTLIRHFGGSSDIENDVKCNPQTVMRIGSISKSLSAVALMQLVEDGQIDLDVPIQTYLPEFPQKTYEGEPVVITTRQLLSHTSGIRHYYKDTNVSAGEINNCREYYISEHYDNVESSMSLFKDDELSCKPGSSHHYSTFGYTVVSAIIEKVSRENYLDYMKRNVFIPLSICNTQPEFNKTITRHRSKYYVRDDKGELENTAYVDNSYKWAGGGFISTSEDIAKFGNALLASYNSYQNNYQYHSDVDKRKSTGKRFILKPVTVNEMWEPVTDVPNTDCHYGLGWEIAMETSPLPDENEPLKIIGHSGGAVGASSILTIIPCQHKDNAADEENGIVVAIICNLQDVKLSHVGKEIGLLAYRMFYNEHPTLDITVDI